MGVTSSNSVVPNEQLHTDFPEFWDSWIKMMGPMIRQNHEKMINKIEKAIPTYYIRYEDLRNNPIPVLVELFKFLLDAPSIEGTVVEKRIHDEAGSGNSTKAIYKLKSSSTNLNRNS